jgi:hypothetical protein
MVDLLVQKIRQADFERKRRAAQPASRALALNTKVAKAVFPRKP